MNSSTANKAVDLTPCTVWNWPQKVEDVPVVILAPDASLHHRVALAWGMASEMQSIAEAGAALQDASAAQALFPVLCNQLHVLERVLFAMGTESARASVDVAANGGAA